MAQPCDACEDPVECARAGVCAEYDAPAVEGMEVGPEYPPLPDWRIIIAVVCFFAFLALSMVALWITDSYPLPTKLFMTGLICAMIAVCLWGWYQIEQINRGAETDKRQRDPRDPGQPQSHP